MARYNIDKAGTRKKLKPRREPYWGAPIDRGLYLGFRKLEHGGNWVARYYDEGRHRYKSLGPEATPYDEAVQTARQWAKTLEAGIDTSQVQIVADACKEYVEDRRREKGEATARDVEGRYQRTVYDDPIGKVKLSKLRMAQIKSWRAKLDMKPASSNRYLSALKAALNYAVASRYVDGGRAIEWQNVKPLEVTARRDLYLERDQRRALIEALPDHAKTFVWALCLLPLRPGALAAATVADLNADALRIRQDKAGAGRTIALPQATADLLQEQAKDKLPAAPLVSYSDGSHWNRWRWKKPIKSAAAAVDLPPETCAYTLRHSVITDMLAGGMDSLTVARMAGTSLAIIEKHYGHLLHKHAADAMARLSL
ncbi:tyrosine-type recombinase/integrase [Salinisphaera sp. USBA-960]|nr:tyrosine-type recombinase/integrase [Salifodinibacter halophilus]NNC27261.1 tyrosine-type recombinase/integrase [Salifodinibacter halophilus]